MDVYISGLVLQMVLLFYYHLDMLVKTRVFKFNNSIYFKLYEGIYEGMTDTIVRYHIGTKQNKNNWAF